MQRPCSERRWTVTDQLAAAVWVAKGESRGVQHEPGRGAQNRRRRVKIASENRVADLAAVDAQLVRATGDGAQFEEAPRAREPRNG